MTDKLKLLNEKIDTVLTELDRLQSENKDLKSENVSLKSEVNKLNQLLSEIQLTRADNTDLVRSRLQTVLQRVEELESLAN